MVADKRDAIIPALKKWWPVLLGISVLFNIVDMDITASYPLISGVTLFLGVVGFAYCCPKLNIKTDISYGMYIYHMVVVNAMIAMGFTSKPWCLLVVVLLSCALAWGSLKFTNLFKKK